MLDGPFTEGVATLQDTLDTARHNRDWAVSRIRDLQLEIEDLYGRLARWDTKISQLEATLDLSRRLGRADG